MQKNIIADDTDMEMVASRVIIKGQEVKPTAIMKNNIKSLFNMMFDYALEYELVDRNYSRSFNLSDELVKEVKTVKKGHIPFTDEEMDYREELYSTSV